MPESDNQEIELELTFLAREIPKEIAGVKPKRLRDIYVPEDSPKPFIRLRQKGNEYEITRKQPISDADLSEQIEETITLDKDQFEALAVASKRAVEKDRYFVEINGYPAEVDVFVGDHAGLVVIDFEFTSNEAKAAFVAPQCCLADVTQELFIAGGQLAGGTYADIESDLDGLNYKKLST